jgi:hypothetical protein
MYVFPDGDGRRFPVANGVKRDCTRLIIEWDLQSFGRSGEGSSKTPEVIQDRRDAGSLSISNCLSDASDRDQGPRLKQPQGTGWMAGIPRSWEAVRSPRMT